MTEWSTAFLGIIAIATLIIALIQVGLVIAARRVFRMLDSRLERVDAQLQPLLRRAERLGDQADEALSRLNDGLVRTGQFVHTTEQQIGRAAHAVGARMRAPVGQAAAVAAGVRAAARTLGRRVRGGEPRLHEDFPRELR